MKLLASRQSFGVLFFLTLIVFAQAQVSVKGIPKELSWENSPKGFFQYKDSFVIESGPKTDMFRDPNVTYNTDNAPKLLFTPDDDFVLTVAIHHRFTSKWDGGAIVLKADNANWVKFCYEKDYTGARRVVSVVTNNISDDCNSVSLNTDQVYFKIAKAGNVITLYCSSDGKKWLLVRHFQFNASGPLRLGFLAQSPDGKNCRVRFSAITYSNRKISDPYKGE